MFRLWIARYADWHPSRWNDVPPEAEVIEPIEDAACSEKDASLFLQGFNAAVLGSPRSIWAVAIPIELRYEGDARPGDRVQGYAFEDPPN